MSRMATLFFLSLFAFACSGETPKPGAEFTAVMAVSTSMMGASGALFRLLDPEDQAVLENQAAAAWEKGLSIRPQDFLALRFVPRDMPQFEPKTRILEENDSSTLVEVAFRDRIRITVHLRQTGGRWRVRLWQPDLSGNTTE